MRPIQLFLIALLVLLGYVALARQRGRLLGRIVIVLFAGVGAFMILLPDLTTDIAQWLGVGRGADLMLYLGVLGFAFIAFVLYTRIRELEAEVTTLARAIAIERAGFPNTEGPNAGQSKVSTTDPSDRAQILQITRETE